MTPVHHTNVLLTISSPPPTIAPWSLVSFTSSAPPSKSVTEATSRGGRGSKRLHRGRRFAVEGGPPGPPGPSGRFVRPVRLQRRVARRSVLPISGRPASGSSCGPLPFTIASARVLTVANVKRRFLTTPSVVRRLRGGVWHRTAIPLPYAHFTSYLYDTFL